MDQTKTYRITGKGQDAFILQSFDETIEEVDRMMLYILLYTFDCEPVEDYVLIPVFNAKTKRCPQFDDIFNKLKQLQYITDDVCVKDDKTSPQDSLHLVFENHPIDWTFNQRLRMKSAIKNIF